MVLEDGWHPDPAGRHDERYYFFGTATARVRDGGVESEDPLPPSHRTPTPGPAVPFAAPVTLFADAPTPERAPTPTPPTTRRPRTPAALRREVSDRGPGRGAPSWALVGVIVLAVAVVATLIGVLATSHGSNAAASNQGSNRSSATSAPATTSDPTSTTTTSTTTTTTIAPAVPSAPKASADQAASALVSAWASGNQAQALTVATQAAVTTLFAHHYQAGGAIDRGCNAASPSTCAFGPAGGASPTDPLYSITVTQAPAGWYVSAVTVEGG